MLAQLLQAVSVWVAMGGGEGVYGRIYIAILCLQFGSYLRLLLYLNIA